MTDIRSTDMKIIETVAEMQGIALREKRSGRTIALVPTMGYLHDGHASLMREGRRLAEVLVATIFVNPKQFGPGEDLATYPRDLERDTRIAREAGVDYLFVPKPGEIYPEGYQTYVDVERISLPLCGGSRPGHFRGVTTVVAKLFNIVQPDTALFGKKDYQQLAVIRRMTADLNMPVRIVGMPIVREADGLAMSSRNAYLSAGERLKGLCLSRGLQQARLAFRQGVDDPSRLRELVTAAISEVEGAVIDYVEVLDGATLEPLAKADGTTVVALAVKIGKTRLIDNCVLGEEE